MKKLHQAFLVLIAGLLSGLALAASAAGTTAMSSARVRHLRVQVEALAIGGNRIVYDAGSSSGNAGNQVLVWNLRTGKTIKVSGRKTAAADTSSTGPGVFQLAIAGSRVAWLVNEGGNTEGDDYLFTSSIVKPKERRVASEVRIGDYCSGRSGSLCAGKWLGGLVGSGSLIAANRWTTDATGAVTAGELDVVSGTKLRRVATGANKVQAAVADRGRVAVLRVDGNVALYSAAGKRLVTVNPPNAEAVALRGKNLVVITKTRQLELYNAHTGSLRKTFSVGGTKRPSNLDVQGNIAIYTVGSGLHTVNLSSGKDRIFTQLRGGPILARIDSAGLVYAVYRYEYRPGTRLAFVPFARVAAKVAG